MAVRFIPHRLTVPFEELDGSPEERSTNAWAGDGATRRLKCLATNRIALERELLGYIEYFGSNALIHLPAPFGIDRPNLVATNVVIKPYGKVSGVISDTRYANYIYVILDVTYEVATKVLSERYGFITLVEELRDLSEFVTLPTKNLYWNTGGNKEAIDAFDAPAKIDYNLEWVYTISNAYTVPSQIFSYVGMVNSTSITNHDASMIFRPGTLLYASPVIIKEMTFGGIVYRITLRFLHKDNGLVGVGLYAGWNYFPRISASGSTTTYERITDGTDNKDFYNSADFRDVFA